MFRETAKRRNDQEVTDVKQDFVLGTELAKVPLYLVYDLCLVLTPVVNAARRMSTYIVRGRYQTKAIVAGITILECALSRKLNYIHESSSPVQRIQTPSLILYKVNQKSFNKKN